MSEMDGNEFIFQLLHQGPLQADLEKAKGVRKDLLVEDEREYVEAIRNRDMSPNQELVVVCHLLNIIDRLAPHPEDDE